MENKKLNETYERPLVEVIDIFPEGSVCTASTEGGNKTGGTWG